MADEKKFVSDDGVSTAAGAVTPEGGTDNTIDKKKKGDLKPETVKNVKAEEVETVEEVVIEESIQSIFEGMDLSEEFKNKVTIVFEAAVNEAVTLKVQELEEELNEKLETELSEAVESKVSEMVENLDAYLDYVVTEWMEENEVAIEAGIKVEMAESLMDGLKDLFSQHNIKVDEETYDIVSELEEEYANLEEKANDVVNENIRLTQELADLQAREIFAESTSELNMSQRERLKVLSENLDTSDLDEYKENLQTIKESFFKGTSVSPKEDVVDEEDEVLIEEAEIKRPVSEYSTVNALVEALNSRKS
jgi:hypothetical protein